MAKLESYVQLANTIRSNREANAKALRDQEADKREEEKLGFTRWEHEQKVKKAGYEDDAAARLEKMDPNAAALLRAGHADLAKTIMSERSEDSKYKKKFQEFNLTTSMVNDANHEFSAMQTEINNLLAAGDKKGAAKMKEQFSVLYQVKKDMISNKIASLDELAGSARTMQLSGQADEVFSKFDLGKLGIAEEAVTKKVKSESAVSSKWINELEEVEQVAGVTVDLKGIPDTQNIYRAATAIVHSGKAPEQMVGDLMNIENPKELRDIADSEDVSPEIRQLAGALYKKRVAAEMFAPSVLEDSTSVSNPVHRKAGGFTFDTSSTRTGKINKLKTAYQVINRAKEMQAEGKALPPSLQRQLDQARETVKGASKEELKMARK